MSSAEMYARCQALLLHNAGMVCFAIPDDLDACTTKLQGLTISHLFPSMAWVRPHLFSRRKNSPNALSLSR